MKTDGYFCWQFTVVARQTAYFAWCANFHSGRMVWIIIISATFSSVSMPARRPLASTTIWDRRPCRFISVTASLSGTAALIMDGFRITEDTGRIGPFFLEAKHQIVAIKQTYWHLLRIDHREGPLGTG